MLLLQYSAWPYRFVLPLHGGQLLLIDGYLLSKGQAVSGNFIHLLSGAMEIKVNSNTSTYPKHLLSWASSVPPGFAPAKSAMQRRRDPQMQPDIQCSDNAALYSAHLGILSALLMAMNSITQNESICMWMLQCDGGSGQQRKRIAHTRFPGAQNWHSSRCSLISAWTQAQYWGESRQRFDADLLPLFHIAEGLNFTMVDTFQLDA